MISDNDNAFLIQNFSEVEVEKVIMDMSNDTAPGPDGFPTCFYKTFWGVIKQPFLTLIWDFFEEKLDLKPLCCLSDL